MTKVLRFVRSPSFVVGVFLLVLGPVNGGAEQGRSRVLALDAYFEIEDNVFDETKLREGLEKARHAREMNRDEAVAYAAESLAALAFGYRHNDRYDARNFDAEALKSAAALATKAYSLDKKSSLVLGNMARIHILRREFDEAQKLIDDAKKIDPEGFYPWFYQGVLNRKMMKFDEARVAYTRAEGLITRPGQGDFIRTHLEFIARAEKNPGEQERVLLAGIKANPTDAYSYGNYGMFLLCNGREEEAIVQLEKAKSIKEYPLLVSELERAKSKVERKKNPGKYTIVR